MTKNIYAAARLACGLTQERAAERLAVSVRSLTDYECGIRRPSDDVLVRMVDVYDAQYLALQHVREGSAIMKQLLPDVGGCTWTEAVLQLLEAVFDFQEEKYDRKLISIARDGKIDDGERAEFDKIVARLQDIMRCSMAVQIGGNLHE